MASREIHPGDAGYPGELRELDPPPTLYVRGSLPRCPGIAVVGRREASEEARTFTWELVRGLAANGYAIWSGGARGIDAAAHEAALDAGALTVVVSGAGLGAPYPPEHGALFDRVLEAGGALLARVSDEIPPRQHVFPARNELLAALTVATVVVEAAFQSGARNTARHARALGRPLCVVPHAPWDERGTGCNLELLHGARPVMRAADVLGAIAGHPLPPLRLRAPRSAARPPSGPPRRPPAEPSAPAALLPPDQQAALEALGSEPAHIDQVCEKTGLSSRVAAAALLTLTLQAVVVEGPAGFYRRASR